MFIIGYCQIFAFHPELNPDKIVIFCSFQQNGEKIYALSHFTERYVRYFDKTTFNQLKDAATNDLQKKQNKTKLHLPFQKCF